jgi:steroid 5-alpha reductase family enzyme
MLLTSRIHPEMTYVDAIFSRSLMALVVFEYFADQQQWNYHQAKHSYQANAKVGMLPQNTL